MPATSAVSFTREADMGNPALFDVIDLKQPVGADRLLHLHKAIGHSERRMVTIGRKTNEAEDLAKTRRTARLIARKQSSLSWFLSTARASMGKHWKRPSFPRKTMVPARRLPS